MGDDIRKDAQPDVAFTFAVGFGEGVAGEGVVEEMTEFKEVIEPDSALAGGHRGGEIIDTLALGDIGGLLSPTDIFAVRGIVH